MTMRCELNVTRLTDEPLAVTSSAGLLSFRSLIALFISFGRAGQARLCLLVFAAIAWAGQIDLAVQNPEGPTAPSDRISSARQLELIQDYVRRHPQDADAQYQYGISLSVSGSYKEA